MLSTTTLEGVPSSKGRLRNVLLAANLPTDDIQEEDRAFFKAVSAEGQTVGYASLEQCTDHNLLRSVVVLKGHRGDAFGQAIVEATLRGVDGDVLLATMNAAPFFASIGFSEVPRAEVPAVVLATR